jgi:hypothetical protein
MEIASPVVTTRFRSVAERVSMSSAGARFVGSSAFVAMSHLLFSPHTGEQRRLDHANRHADHQQQAC